MQKTSIFGIGQTAVREHWGMGMRDLAATAILDAMADAGVEGADALYVGNMLSGTLASQEHLGALVADYAGLRGIEAVKVEAACGSAAAAFRHAMLSVASGQVDTAIAVGVEKLTEMSGMATTHGLATAADADYEASMGLSFVAINALLMRRYMHEYGFKKDDFAPLVMTAHANGCHNPNAMFQKAITLSQYSKAKMIADPVNLLDSSPVADGAAAVVVRRADATPQSDATPVRILACEIATDSLALDNRRDPLWLEGGAKSVAKALKTAGRSHGDIQFFEAHDAFSIMTALSLEASGFAERGQALKLAAEKQFEIGSRLPIATFGGLKGRGHPVGATGLYQIVEAAQQLRHVAPDQIQVADATCGMTQNIGGSGATVITTILEK